MPWPCLVAEALCLNSSGPETMAPETLVPEEIAPSNPEAWLDDQHGLGIPAPGGGKCQRGSGLGVCRARRYTRNAG